MSSLYLSFKVGKLQLSENINSNFHDTSINDDNLLIKASYVSSFFWPRRISYCILLNMSWLTFAYDIKRYFIATVGYD